MAAAAVPMPATASFAMIVVMPAALVLLVMMAAAAAFHFRRHDDQFAIDQVDHDFFSQFFLFFRNENRNAVDRFRFVVFIEYDDGEHR